MTHFVNPKEVGSDLVAHLVSMTKRGADQIGGADYTFDCTGNVAVMRQALEATHRGWGQSNINNAKKQWGERFGMTHFVNPKEVGSDLVAHLVSMTKRGADQIGGADYTFDCTGNVTVMRQALEATHRGWGQSIIIGVAPAGAEIATRPFQLVTGRVWKGTAFGGARGRTDVPKIVDWYMEGKIEIDPMITHTMPLPDINKGFELMHEGKSIRSVVVY